MTDHHAFATRALHGPRIYRDHEFDPAVEAIYTNTTYHFPDAATAEEWFLHPREHFLYSRYGNPTVRDFEERMAMLEGGADAVAFASGTSAFLAALLTVVHAGEHVLLQRHCYGGSFYLASKLGPMLGIDASLIDPNDLDACSAAITPHTKAICIETPSNPSAQIVDLAAVTDWAHGHDLAVVVDSTFASPALQTPIAFGADVVWHSASKYIGGHGDVMGGVVVLRTEERAEDLWERWMTGLGTNLSPFNAFLLVRGLKTLALRMDRQSATALALAQWLAGHPAIAQVSYPGLESHPGHGIARKQMKAYGAMMAVTVAGGRDAAFRFHDRLQLILRTTSLGDVCSLISHPASTSHRQFSEDDRLAWGVSQGTLRVSIGLEDLADLQVDIDQALG